LGKQPLGIVALDARIRERNDRMVPLAGNLLIP
jgi:hypothetical protein